MGSKHEKIEVENLVTHSLKGNFKTLTFSGLTDLDNVEGAWENGTTS